MIGRLPPSGAARGCRTPDATVSEYQEQIPRGRSSTSSGTCGSNGLTREIELHDVVNLACLILSLKRGIVMHCAGGRKAIASLSGTEISGASSIPP